jgi:thiamine-monophosphate kinase
LVIGQLGHSRLGLEYLRKTKTVGLNAITTEEGLREWARNPNVYEWLRAHLIPEIYLKPAIWIRENGLANSMIDISDGLGQDLWHILEESQLSGELEMELLPRPRGLRKVGDAAAYALDGGEDYALLLTASKEQLEHLKLGYPEEFPGITVIGRLYSGPVALYLKAENGKRSRYKSGGFNHFK